MKTIKNFITHPLMVVFIIMSIITAGLFAMNEALINTGFYDKNPLQLIDEHYVFEYGDFASGDIEDYFNILDSERLEECMLTLDIPLDEAGRQVPGSYVATWNWKNFWREEGGVFTIDIVDTIYPRISLNANEVKVKHGVEYDINSNVVSVVDVIEGDIPYEAQGEVNVKKAGTYEIKVIAADSHGNTSEKTFKVKVPEPGYTYPIKYSDGSATITITKEWYGSSWNYIAHIQFSNYSRFGTAVGKGVYGGKETTSSAAKRLGALLAVNGCYSAPNLNYRVVRKGVIYNGANTGTWVPAVYSSNNGLLLSAWETGGTPGIAGVTLQTLVDSGLVTDTFNFGPPILVNGVVKAGSAGGRAQRTTIGTSGAAGDIWLVVSDGRKNDGVSVGPTYGEVAELLASKGCTFAVPLDGGGSSTMVWKGTVLNAARGKQRAVVDFVYFK